MNLGKLLFAAVILAAAVPAAASERPRPQPQARILSAEEIVERLARRGYREVAVPQRRGQIYLVEATDRDGGRRQLVVTVTEALIVGDGPAPRAERRAPGRIMPAAVRE